MDYYAVLDLKPDCTDDDIKAHYRRLARECHPDVNPDDRAAATEKLRLINEAYAVLSKPAKRRRYDTKRSGGASTETNSPPRRPRVYDNVGPMSAEQIYRAQRRQNGRNLILGVIVFFIVASVVYRTPPGTPAPWASPSPPAQPAIETPPAAPFDPAPQTTVPTDLETSQSASSSSAELKATFDRVQPQINRVLTRGIDIRNQLSGSRIDPTNADSLHRLSDDLKLLQTTDNSVESDVAALRQETGASNNALVTRASEELQEAVLAGRNVIRDVRDLNGSSTPTP